ncbi:MAG: hypothetical protein K8S87_02380, partial [Planctomycetes bacterium]|nr:hypothetical protein [Planctomycetota bacterium]
LSNKTDFDELEARLNVLEATKKDNPDHEALTEEKFDPIYKLFRVYSVNNFNPENGIEIILRTEERLRDSQLKQIIRIYTKNLENAETAIPIIGDVEKFNIWKKSGKVAIIFTRQREDKKFEDYYKLSLTITY